MVKWVKWDRTHTANQLQDIYKHLGSGEESNDENDQVSISGRIVESGDAFSRGNHFRGSMEFGRRVLHF